MAWRERIGVEPTVDTAGCLPTDLKSHPHILKLLNKLSITKIAELSNLSKSYISQVRSGKRPPSDRLLQALRDYYLATNKGRNEVNLYKTVNPFLQSRRDGLSLQTVDGFYRQYLGKAIPILGLTPTTRSINIFLNSLSCSPGGKHAYYRAMRAFYNWLYSPKSGFNLERKENPVLWVDAPKVPRVILPSLSKEQVQLLIKNANNVRDKAIISLFTESGLRLSELVNIKAQDIDWQSRIVRTMGKGGKEGYAPFGKLTEQYLRCWLNEYRPKIDDNIWGISYWHVSDM